MRAMILAAGAGKRMQPLTLETPKPLLTVKGKPLIVYHLEAFFRAGITDIVINLGHLGEKIVNALGSGEKFGVSIQYSYENPVLETGGGIAKALPLLGSDPFIVVSADVLTDYSFEKLPKKIPGLAHLVLVDNPPYHLTGDFALKDGRIVKSPGPLLNFGGFGIYTPQLFTHCPIGAFPVAVLFDKAMQAGLITGEYYAGWWHNVGTPEQLALLNIS